MDGIGNFGNFFNGGVDHGHPEWPPSPSSQCDAKAEETETAWNRNQEGPLNLPHNSRDENLARTLRSRVPYRPRTPSFSFEDVKRVTKKTDKQTVDALFPNLGTHDLDAVFGSEREPLQNLSTELNYDLAFLNSYGETIWVMRDNVRNSDMAPDFHMNDVVAYQAECAGVDGHNVRHLVRYDVTSTTGIAFFGRHPFNHMDQMSPDQLEKFMRQTVNGRSSEWICKDNGLRVESGRILKYPDQELFGWPAYSVVLNTEPEPSLSL